MQKIYIGKGTNSVSQIIEQHFPNYDNYDEFTFGNRYYMVEVDDDKHLDCHDYFYDPYSEEFEKIEGITKEDHRTYSEESPTDKLIAENLELKNRLDAIEKALGIKL